MELTKRIIIVIVVTFLHGCVCDIKTKNSTRVKRQFFFYPTHIVQEEEPSYFWVYPDPNSQFQTIIYPQQQPQIIWQPQYPRPVEFPSYPIRPPVINEIPLFTTTQRPQTTTTNYPISTDINSNCGRSYVKSNPLQLKIVNGQPFAVGKYPWLVAIMRDYGQTHWCGASLLSSNYVVSAAHCFEEFQTGDIQELRVFIGDHDIYDSYEVPSIYSRVVKVIIHSNWNKQDNTNDIAILKLATPVKFSRSIQPICLADSSLYEPGSKVIAAGWGRVHFQSTLLQRQPLEISIPIISPEICGQRMNPLLISRDMVCSGGDGSSTCLGDSGGPLMKQGSDGTWRLVGITSWGVSCRGISVYTKVSEFVEWIRYQMQQ